MKRKKFKYIYESLPEELMSLFEELHMEVSDEVDEETLTIGADNGNHFSLDRPSSLIEFFQNSGEILLCPKALKDPLFLQMTKNIINKGGFINVNGMSGGLIDDSENVRMTDHMSVGYYSDIIGTDAFEMGFNFIRVRKYLLNILTYFSYLNKGEIAFIPVDIEYGMNDSHLMIQIHANVQNFVKDYLWEALDSHDHKSPFSSLVGDSLKNVDFLCVTYLQSASKVIFTGSWAKNIPLEDWFSSIAIRNVQSFDERKEELLSRPRVKVVKTTVKMESGDLPGRSSQIRGGTEDNTKNLVKIKRVIEVIQKVKKSEGINLEESSQDEIDEMLNQIESNTTENFSEDERDYISEAIKDNKELSRIDAGIDRLLNPFESKRYIELFTESIDDLSAEEVNTYLKKDEAEDEQITDEDWQVKKLKIVDDIKSQSEDIQNSGGGRRELNTEILKVVSRELEAIEEDCSPMVDDLADKVTEQMISDKIDNADGDPKAMALEHARELRALKIKSTLPMNALIE